MFTKYIQAAMQHTKCEKIADGSFHAVIPEFYGVVFGNADTYEESLEDLQNDLEHCIRLWLQISWFLPVINGIDLNSKQNNWKIILPHGSILLQG